MMQIKRLKTKDVVHKRIKIIDTGFHNKLAIFNPWMKYELF